MTMCTSGSLGIIICPQGGCSSIAFAVDGNVTPPKSLSALSISAGFSAPHSMREFYSYPSHFIALCDIPSEDSGVNCVDDYVMRTSCICSNPALIAGQCYNICIDYYISAVGQAPASTSYVMLTCQDICVVCFSVDAGNYYSGTFSTYNIKYGEAWSIVNSAYAADTLCANCSSSCATIIGISGVVGTYALGTPLICCVETG